MDFLAAHRRKQTLLISIVAITAILANLPPSFSQSFFIEREYLLAVLGLLFMLGLFLYAKFSLLLLTTLLVIGANLPDRWSSAISVDKTPLIASLLIMVFASLLNQTKQLLPPGLEPPKRSKNPAGLTQMLRTAHRPVR